MRVERARLNERHDEATVEWRERHGSLADVRQRGSNVEPARLAAVLRSN